MNETIILELTAASKTYHRSLDATVLRELFAKGLRKKNKPAGPSLAPLSLSFKTGESVAIIGRNGSGKSTLLKMIAGITFPSSGSITLKGKITSMLELGAGFHPDFSGRENISLNGSLFGMSNAHLASKTDEIIEFSELEGKIDEQVRTYSAGMLTRLAFSIAVQADPEILLIDEVLSVGDIAFQQKCLKKLHQLISRGNVTLILVTHNLDDVLRFCQRCLWIDRGILRLDGKPEEVVAAYKDFMLSEQQG